MSDRTLIVIWITALLTLGAGGSVHAQQQTQPVPEAPQPQKKAAPEKAPGDKASQPTSAQPASTKDDNPFPEAVSQDAAKGAQTPSAKKPGAEENPFPESVSRHAAKAAGNDQSSTPAPAAKRDLPPGISSSTQSDDVSGTAENPIADPARAKKDAEVGGFYLKTGDYQGALLRYKDAEAADPTNVDAIFGLAETQRVLKKNAEAAKNYQLYLEIVPNGPKAKQALKALKALGSGQ